MKKELVILILFSVISVSAFSNTVGVDIEISLASSPAVTDKETVEEKSALETFCRINKYPFFYSAPISIAYANINGENNFGLNHFFGIRAYFLYLGYNLDVFLNSKTNNTFLSFYGELGINLIFYRINISAGGLYGNLNDVLSYGFSFTANWFLDSGYFIRSSYHCMWDENLNNSNLIFIGAGFFMPFGSLR